MSRLESLLSEAQSLTNAERLKLAELLLKQAALEAEEDDVEVGQRGLLTWTASVRGEDWSAYYPHRLRSLGASGKSGAVRSGGPSSQEMRASGLS